MPHTISPDGTPIAHHTVGSGPTVVIVGGALSTAADATEVAEAFAEAGLRAVTYDRRARGASGYTPPAEPLREVEDLAAVIAAVGGDAAVLGHSSGAVLALYACGEGVPMTHLFLTEPPFRFGAPTAAGLADRLQALVDEGRNDTAIETFLREAVELPEPAIAEFRNSPVFEAVTALARSTVLDTLVTERTSVPSTAMTDVDVPVTIMCGIETFPFLVDASRRLAEVMPRAEHLTVPEMIGHRPDPVTTARLVAERVRSQG